MLHLNKLLTLSIKDYFRIYRYGGLGLTIKVFTNVVNFDLIHGTDTARRDFNKKFLPNNELDKFGVTYFPSWDIGIDYAYHFTLNLLGEKFEDYVFFDIGCGKGKVMIFWNLLLRKSKLNQEVIGIDYSDDLVKIAHKNFIRVLSKTSQIYIESAIDFDFSKFGSKFIFYLYNPFDWFVLEKFINKISDFNFVLIYVNPVHHDKLRLRLIEQCDLLNHPSANIAIYIN
jgi:SAM-dependent methyltransferase